MDGKVVLIVGGRGMGKTSLVKKLIKNVHPEALLLHDVGGQYKDVYKKPILDFKDFTVACTKVENAVIVFEEATIFIRYKSSDEIINFLVTSRYRNNRIYFVFHSLRKVPFDMFDLSDIIILLKTNENADDVQSRFKDNELTKVFTDLNNQPLLFNETEQKYYSPLAVYNLSGR